MERPTERQVLDWLVSLGQLVASNQPLAEVRERLMAYLPMLVEHYDSRDFNQASREFVARNCKFFPSYGELCGLLDKWPKPAAKPPAGTADAGDLTGTDRQWFNYFHKRQAEDFRTVRDGDPPSSREHVLSLVKSKSFKAWSRITGITERVGDPTDAELEAVHNAVQRATKGLRAFRTEQERIDRQLHRGLENPPRPPPDATLKGDALRQARKAAGINIPVPNEPFGRVPEPVR